MVLRLPRTREKIKYGLCKPAMPNGHACTEAVSRKAMMFFKFLCHTQCVSENNCKEWTVLRHLWIITCDECGLEFQIIRKFSEEQQRNNRLILHAIVRHRVREEVKLLEFKNRMKVASIKLPSLNCFRSLVKENTLRTWFHEKRLLYYLGKKTLKSSRLNNIIICFLIYCIL